MSIIDLRYAKLGTREELNADNIVLAFMQPGIEKDTGDTKLGDGRTKYRDLAYFTGSLTRTYRGEVASQAEMVALQANISDWCTRTDDGNRNYELTSLPANKAGNWTSYISGTIESGVSVADMNAAIQSAVPTLLSQLGGFTSTSSIKTANGQILETVLQQLLSNNPTPSASAPTITSAPSVDDTTPTVDQVINITLGGITNGSGRSTVSTVKVSFPGLVGFQPVYQTALTYRVPANALGYPMIVTHRAADSVIPTLYVERDSLVTSAVAGVVPTVTVAATMSPSGAQAAGVKLVYGNGTVTLGTGASIVSRTYQTYVAGIAVPGGRTTSNEFQTDSSHAGKVITADMVAIDNLNLASAPSTLSNSATIAGTAYQASSAVALAATVTEGIQGAITPAVWPTTYNGNPFSVTVVRREIFYDGDIIIGATLPSAYLFYTPELAADLPSVLLTAGYTKTSGAVIKVKETVTGSDGQTYYSVSATKTIQAASATLGLSLTAAGQAGVSWIVGTQIAPATFAAATGGTGTYTYAMTVLPAGVALSSGGTAWPITGTPSSPFSLADLAITVRDSANNTAGPVYVSVQVSAAGVTALPSAFQAGPNYALEAPNDANTNNYSAKGYSNGLSIPPLSGVAAITRSGITRLGPATVDGQSVIRHEVRSGDPTRNSGNRAELSYDSMQLQHGVDYWMAFAIKLDSDWTAANSGGSGDQQSLMQVHQQTSETTLTNGGPFGIKWRGNSGSEIEIFSLGPNNSPVTRFVTSSTANVWMKFIIHYRSGVNSGQAPNLEIWKAVNGSAYTKLTDLSPGALFGDPAQSITRDWAKIGIYKWTTGTYGSTTKRGMYSSGLFYAAGVDKYSEAAAAIASF